MCIYGVLFYTENNKLFFPGNYAVKCYLIGILLNDFCILFREIVFLFRGDIKILLFGGVRYLCSAKTATAVIILMGMGIDGNVDAKCLADVLLGLIGERRSTRH